jgi:precorrin-2 dehydrogenase / sirohydrochlorin ferrochelatase
MLASNLMRYLPVFVDLTDRACVVVGGGQVAARKIALLLEAGARVRVIAPRIGPETERLRESVGARLEILRRGYRSSDLDGAVIAFAATDDPELHDLIARDARERGVWLNVADEPERCSFVMPAVARRGPVTIAVSSSGTSPALARRIRDELDGSLGPEYAEAAELLAALRRRHAPGPARREALRRILDHGLLEALRANDRARVERLTREAFGGPVGQEAASSGTRP